MTLIIFSIFIIPFLFEDPFLFPFLCKDYFIYAILAGIIFLRVRFNEEKKIKVFAISFITGLIYLLVATYRKEIVDLFYSGYLNNPALRKEAILFQVEIVKWLSLYIGAVSIGFLIYNFIKSKGNGNKIYWFIEASIIVSFIGYYFVGAKAYYAIFPSIATSIVIHTIYFALMVYIKIMEPVKLKKLAVLRQEILANYPDSPLR